jgi:hypothetical protein
MMNGVGCSTAAGAAAGAASGPTRSDREQMLSSTADLLKMSVTDLKAKLQTGASLDDIAKAQGVSHDDLVNNIVSSLKSRGAGGATRSDASLTAMAGRIAGHHRGHHHHPAQAADPSSSAGPSPVPATGAPAGGTGGSLLDVRA